ncbi:centrosomal protein of 72 kDa isoform X1 [Clarias gariepinus]|uniref:centrosomal protein of 72 kDa isoform X1 n=1 Tax=Clarias gariepinus TaxID=13013 RepID=UPI00234E17FC|nr:centrosomal protein of 72 kDa isoform X1 [Clarias gariepinus]
MAATRCLSITERWIRDELNLQHQCLADVRSLRLPGTNGTDKIVNLGISLKNFVRLKSLDLSHNALVSVEGILHLKLLENLNLYFNRISSLQDVLSLGSLQNLKELDLRLNPAVERDPHYRLHLVQAISKLRKLDDCPVRDRERKVALMHFSAESGLESSQKSPLSVMEIRNSNPRIAAVNKIMMSKLMFREGNEETVLNHNFKRNRNILTQEVCAEKSCKPESAHLQETRHTIRPRHLKDAPRVTFDEPSVKRCTSFSIQKTPFRIQAEGYFTPNPSNKNGSSQVHAVRMEQEVTNGKSEVTTLREEIRLLSDQINVQKREHQSEVRRLSEQLKQAHRNIEHCDQELRSVLEENVSLQKQLIRLEQQLLSDKLREMPNSHC